MINRLRQFAKTSVGGTIAFLSGTLWQVIEAAHNWTYISDLAHRSGLVSAANASAEPSAIAMMLCGALWVFASSALRQRHEPTITESTLAKEIEAVTKSSCDMMVRLHEDRNGRDIVIIKRSNSRVG